MDQKLISVIDSVMCTSVNAIMETQVVLQLLVKKGIVTREEVEETRKLVQKNTEYGKLYTELTAKIAADSDQSEYFINTLMQAKMFAPDSMSDTDNEILAKMLQREYAKKDAQILREAMLKELNGQELTKEEERTIKKYRDQLEKEEEKEDE